MKAPWHLWVIGIVTLIWNAGGAFDYFMTQSQNESYMSNFTAEQLAYFYSFPTWTNATWAIAVWLAVLGSVLLLMRNSLALWSYVVSFVGLVLTSVYTYLIADVSSIDLMGVGSAVFTLLIFIVSALLIWYARAMKQRGVLR